MAEEERPSLVDIGAEELFEKVLTSSDANAQGRVVIPKAQAVQHLPPLDRDAVEVPCQDTCGNHHTFRFHSWINNQSRMFLLEGTQDVQALYGLSIGDSLVFGRLPSGALVAFGRKRRGPPLQPRAAASEKIVVTLDRAKRRKRGQHTPYDSSSKKLQWQPQDPLIPYFEPLLDGTFRVVPNGIRSEEGQVGLEHGTWTATVNLAGELYQAFFENQEAAQEAFQAATGQYN